jgi:hypothetical protein
MTEHKIAFTVLLCLLFLAAPAATIGQKDTFTTGTENWIAPDPGNPNPPSIALGGSGGALDSYLKLVANGLAGPGSRLTVLNGAQWTGSFLTIGGIAMDVKNFGPSDVFLRLLFEHMTIPNTPPVDLALSKNYIQVAAGSDWTHIVFPIDPGSLLALLGTADGALGTTTVMRIFSNPDPTFFGPGNGPPAIAVTLGVDNIAAIPEPATAVLIAAGIGAVAWRRRSASRI